MASSAELRVGVKVELEVGERTAEWLESMGWIRPDAPSEESVLTELEDVAVLEDEYDPRPVELVQASELAPAERPKRAMTGSEAMLCAARRLRKKLRSELEDPDALDELLRLCDVNVGKLQDASDCDC
jgi:hypothetical protein